MEKTIGGEHMRKAKRGMTATITSFNVSHPGETSMEPVETNMLLARLAALAEAMQKTETAQQTDNVE